MFTCDLHGLMLSLKRTLSGSGRSIHESIVVVMSIQLVSGMIHSTQNLRTRNFDWPSSLAGSKFMVLKVGK